MLFVDLINLEHLLLGANQLAEVNQEMFEGLVNLKYLDLVDNPIGKIENSPFVGLVNLESLSLADFRRFNELMLDDQQSLHKIRSNSFHTLDPLMFSNLKKTKKCNYTWNQSRDSRKSNKYFWKSNKLRV